MNFLKKSINQIKRYIRFRKICNALGFKPIGWQKRLVLCGHAKIPRERRTGKTTGVILNALVINPNSASTLYDLLSIDPDFGTTCGQIMWEYGEYYRKAVRCNTCGINVNLVYPSQFRAEIAKRNRHYRQGVKRNDNV